MSKLDEYVTISEAADYLGVCCNTLRNWGASGKIREHRNPMNDYRLYAPKDLDSLLKQIRTSGASCLNLRREKFATQDVRQQRAHSSWFWDTV